MAKPCFDDGICLNSEHNGLLSVEESRLEKLIKKEPITDVYHVEHTPFARGKFATVRKCRCPLGGGEFAAKFIRKRRRLADQRQDILHEVAVLRVAEPCPRIVRLRDVFETPAEMALVLEMAAGGELQRVLDHEEGLEEAQAARIMRQILEGLGFLHERNIAHLDLKPQNLLMTGTYPDCDIKLCDFGISRVICHGIEVREILGTPDYVAPEILNYEPISLATDIWSVGVLAYVLLTGYSPFGGDTKQETFCNIAQGKLSFPDELFDGISSSARDFICATLVKNPRKRLSSQECLLHPWLCGGFVSPCKGDTSLTAVAGCAPVQNGHSSHREAESDECDGSALSDICNGTLENGNCNGVTEPCKKNEESTRKESANSSADLRECNGEHSGEEIEENCHALNGIIESEKCNEEVTRSTATLSSTGKIDEESLDRKLSDESGGQDETSERKNEVQICDSSGGNERPMCNGSTNFEKSSRFDGFGEIGSNNFVGNKVHSYGFTESTKNFVDGIEILREDTPDCRFRGNVRTEAVTGEPGQHNLVFEKGSGEISCTKSVPELTVGDDLFARAERESGGEVRPCDAAGTEEEGLPVKRSKNCCRRSSYPVSSCVSCAQCKEQCCHLHPAPGTDVLTRIARQHRIPNISNSPVEIVLDRGIIC